MHLMEEVKEKKRKNNTRERERERVCKVKRIFQTGQLMRKRDWNGKFVVVFILLAIPLT